MTASVSRVARSVYVTLPLHLISLANARGHWAKKHQRVRFHRPMTRLALGPSLHGIWGMHGRLEVRITRIAPRALDCDNNVSACKNVRDGIADALGINDRDPRVSWSYAQQRGEPKQYAVRIEVTGVGS